MIPLIRGIGFPNLRTLRVSDILPPSFSNLSLISLFYGPLAAITGTMNFMKYCTNLQVYINMLTYFMLRIPYLYQVEC